MSDDSHLGAVSDVEPQITCDKCGEISDELQELPDCDRTVGYHGSVIVCPKCSEGYRNNCGMCG